jgi:F0F1-type ATP synthase membrane subunit b/b'
MNNNIKINNINTYNNDLDKRNREIQKTITKINANSKVFQMILDEYIKRGGQFDVQENRNQKQCVQDKN